MGLRARGGGEHHALWHGAATDFILDAMTESLREQVITTAQGGVRIRCRQSPAEARHWFGSEVRGGFPLR
jgi:hypothetical protein